MLPLTRDRAAAHHGEATQVSGAVDVPDSAVAAAPEGTIDVMALPCIDDFELPPARDYAPLPARPRTRPRQAAPAPFAGNMSASLAEVAEKRRSGEFERARAEADAVVRGTWREAGGWSTARRIGGSCAR